jgi:hypothetical protein
MAGDTIIIEVYKIMENMSSLVQEYQIYQSKIFGISVVGITTYQKCNAS